MAYAEILRLTVEHAYFGPDVAPLTVAPADPRAFDRAGLLLRQRGATTIVLGDETAERETRLSLRVTAQSPQVQQVTRDLVWGAPVAVTVPLDRTRIGLTDATAPAPPENRHRLGSDLAVLDIELPQDGARVVTLALEAIDAHWAYHLVSTRDLDGIEVIDTAGDVVFEDLGSRTLPDGQATRVIRSAQALAARARPGQRFALQKAGAFGPETLVAVLPAAAPPFKPIPDAETPARLQSDIFVTLW